MEKEYIQLPALKRDLDSDVVKALWAFIQLPEEYQARYQEQYELLNQRKEEADRQLQENIEKIDADAIHLYEETMRSMIRDIVQQSCNLACWVRYHKYDLEESLEEMIDQQPHAAKYIIANITAQITIATIPLRNDPTIAIFGSSTAEKYATSTTLIPATINPRKYRRSPVCA